MKTDCQLPLASHPRGGVQENHMKEREPERRPLFDLGQVVATPGALSALEEAVQAPVGLLARHITGDWGDLVDEDREANDQALREGSRLLSAYHLATGVKVWVITEWDRSVTTLLLPDEY